MGKVGRALREAKKQTIYTFTREQLEARDNALLKEQKDRIMKQMSEEAKKREKELRDSVHEYMEKEFKEREELLKAGDNGLFENLISYVVAVPCRILIEHFGWKPIRNDGKYRQNMKIDRFCKWILKELNDISDDENKDIRNYADEVLKLYGVGIEAVEE